MNVLKAKLAKAQRAREAATLVQRSLACSQGGKLRGAATLRALRSGLVPSPFTMPQPVYLSDDAHSTQKRKRLAGIPG